MYDLFIKPTADRIFRKMSKRDKERSMMVHKKVLEIRENPHHGYKHLRRPLEDFYRVHIDSSYVLIFSIDHAERSVTLYYFGHHDSVYSWRPREE